MTDTGRNNYYDHINRVNSSHGSTDMIAYTQKISDHQFRIHNASDKEEAKRILYHDGSSDDLNRVARHRIALYVVEENYIDIFLNLYPS